MGFTEVAWFLTPAVAAAFLTEVIRKRALAHGVLDVPNARSSHAVATPRGGGLAIVVTLLAALGIAGISGSLNGAFATAMAAGATLVAGVGYLDDVRGLSAMPRLLVHFAASIVTIGTLARFGPDPGLFSALPTLVAAILLVLGLVWSLNLFNFMDGIDGFAASQAAFVGLASAGLMCVHQPSIPAVVVLPLATAGACGGFLAWNWPPARIFMGDVGSGFLGFWLAALALVLNQAGALDIWASVILGSAFIGDSTVTLLRRVARRERWYEAHRSHAYQHLSRRWGTHRSVTLLLWALNVGMALPLAAVSLAAPQAAPVIALGALVGFGLLALLAGAGSREPSEAS